jgi:hypothetical protein
VPPAASDEVSGAVKVVVEQSELGHFVLEGHSSIYGEGWDSQLSSGPYAVGQSPPAARPDNRAEKGKLASDPLLQPRVTVDLEPETRKVTTADALEALHRASGLPLIADAYTRLYPVGDVTVRDMRLLDALNRLADRMRMRWHLEEGWLKLRTVSYYHDRLKEVPNHLLKRWSTARKRHGVLTLDELVQIAALSDAQLDGSEMAEGAREVWALKEWDLCRDRLARPHLRFLARLTPEQRQEALGSTGLLFTRMSLAQQQQFLALALEADSAPIRNLSDLEGATLRVDYTQPGEFQWGDPGLFHNWTRWVIPVEPGQHGRRVVRPALRGRSREEVLQGLRRLEPKMLAAAVHRADPRFQGEEASANVPLEAQVFPTELRLVFVYIPSLANARALHIVSGGIENYQVSF